MRCEHLWTVRNLNPDLRGNKPKLYWVCMYCGEVKGKATGVSKTNQ